MARPPCSNSMRETWAAFPTCEAAYATQSGIYGFRLHTNTLQPMPRYGPGGIICFMSDWYHVHLFDGRTWHEWEAGQIVGEKDAGVTDQPFFNKAGNPSLTWGRATWEWTAEKGWHSIAFEAGPDNISQQDQPAAPPGSPVPHPDSLALDGPDAAWLTYHRQLYKVAFGLSAPHFASGTAHPFLDGRNLTGVLHDNQSNTFLRTAIAGYSEHILLPAAPPPDTHVSVTPMAPDTVRVELTTRAAGPHWFVWRLDGGAWSTAAHTGTATLDFLPGGPHQIEARTLDARLNYETVPAYAAFVIEADPAKQVAALIETLKRGDDNVREAAVTRLRRFPTLAPPALQAARVGATEDQRWWIDAALQQFGLNSDSTERTR